MGIGGDVAPSKQSESGAIMNQVDGITAELREMVKQVNAIETGLGICQPNAEQIAKDAETPSGFFACLKAKLKTVDRLSGQIKRSLDNIKSEF